MVGSSLVMVMVADTDAYKGNRSPASSNASVIALLSQRLTAVDIRCALKNELMNDVGVKTFRLAGPTFCLRR
jgi:hypothetical protein